MVKLCLLKVFVLLTTNVIFIDLKFLPTTLIDNVKQSETMNIEHQ